MNTIYLDTNIFMYLTQSQQPDKTEQCLDLIKYIKKFSLEITTSLETIQEIINWSSKTQKRRVGLEIARETIQISNELYPVNQKTIEIFLVKAKKYQLNHSRDLLHLATCIEHSRSEIITFDSAFKNFTEIQAFTPKQYIQART